MSKLSLNALKAFEVAARLQSLTRAAEEMNVTQAAISRQVRALEEYLEVNLFKRKHRSVLLTSEGKRLFSSITGPFSEIEHAASLASRRSHRSTLAVRSYTTFAQRWLVPRLASFYAQYPRTEVLLSASNAPVDLDRDHIDVAIRYGSSKEEFSHLESDFIVPFDLTPVCSPALLKAMPTDPIEFLRHSTLLHSIARPEIWTTWLRAAGLIGCANPDKGLRFETSSLVYDAAIQGIGVAMGVVCLVADDIRAGRLVAPFKQLHRDGGFFLVYRRAKFHASPVLQFRDWIREKVKTATALNQNELVPQPAAVDKKSARAHRGRDVGNRSRQMHVRSRQSHVA